METIPLTECTKIGNLKKPHGLHGELYLIFNEEFNNALETTSILFIKAEGLLVPFFIENEGLNMKTSGQAFVKFRWVDSEEKAREFSGREVYLKKQDIQAENKKTAFEKLAGFMVLDPQNKKIGRINKVNNYSGNIVLTIISGGKETLVPLNEELIKKLDADKKTIHIIVPEGLF